jgi:nucleoside-diphosphate-sugar epimerase
LYGSGDTHDGYGPNRFLRTAREEHRITLFGNGEEKRDHVYIGDLSRLIGLCLAHRSEGVLNVATGTSTSFSDVARIIAGLYQDEVLIDHQPHNGPITHRHFDIANLIRAFPSFRSTPLQEGLPRSVNAEVVVHG